MSRGGEEATAQQQGQRDNKLANNRKTGEEASVHKRWQSIERTRGGGSGMRGVKTTSWQMRGKGGGGTSGQRGGSVLKMRGR